MIEKTKILIVDDEEAICEIVKLNLERTDRYEVFATTSGEDGIAFARENKPDLIILDIYMPEMSGPEVAERLSSDPVTKAIPIVFLTGVVTKKDIEANRGIIGGRRFIAKPITSSKLVEVIKSALRKKNF